MRHPACSAACAFLLLLCLALGGLSPLILPRWRPRWLPQQQQQRTPQSTTTAGGSTAPTHLEHLSWRPPRVPMIPMHMTRAALETLFTTADDPDTLEDIFVVPSSNDTSSSTSTSASTPDSHPPCESGDDVFPGRVASRLAPLHNRTSTSDADRIFDWHPASGCRLQTFTAAEAQECLRGTRLLILGDSVARELALGLAVHSGLHPVGPHDDERRTGVDLRLGGGWVKPPQRRRQRRRSKRYVGGETMARFLWLASAFQLLPWEEEGGHTSNNNSGSSSSSSDPLGMKAAVTDADVVVLHHGNWNVGYARCRGVHRFLQSLTRRLLALRALMRPAARLVLLELRWVHHTRRVYEYLPRRAWSLRDPAFSLLLFQPGNARRRLAAYREAQRAAAACVGGVELLRSAEMFRAVPRHTEDGVHHSHPAVLHMVKDHLLNAVCARRRQGRPALALGAPVCEAAQVRAAWERWASDPLVCGCPDDTAANKNDDAQRDDLGVAFPDSWNAFARGSQPLRRSSSLPAVAAAAGVVPPLATAGAASAAETSRPLCAEARELAPGAGVGGRSGVWIPSAGAAAARCRLARFSAEEGCACLRAGAGAGAGATAVVVVGDEVAEALARGLDEGGCGVRYAASASVFGVLEAAAAAAAKGAGVVVLHQAVGDTVGVGGRRVSGGGNETWCKGGVAAYAEALAARVAALKGVVGSAGRVLLYETPWVAAGGGGSGAEGKPPPRVVAAYREAMRVVSACTETDVVLHRFASRAFPSDAVEGGAEGLVYGAVVHAIVRSVVLNGLCPRRGSQHDATAVAPPMAFHRYGGCEALREMAQARWREDPVLRGC